MTFYADLHIHSCLSPCVDIDMSPKTICRKAAGLGIDLLGLSDHNNCGNLPAFAECCRREGLQPVFGMELTTIEEVHVLCLFGELDAALDFGRLVDAHYPRFPLDLKFWYPQYRVGPDEEILEELEHLLAAASLISLGTCLEEVLSREGLCIPAHIDRPQNSLLSQLGFVDRAAYSALEITMEADLIPGSGSWQGLALVANSDAHQLEALASRHTEFEAGRPGFRDYAQALRAGRVRAKFEPRAGRSPSL